MTTLTDKAAIVAKLVRILASPNSGEVVAAAHALQRVLHNAGLDLHDLATEVELIAPHKTARSIPPGASQEVVRAMTDVAYRHANALASPELQLVHEMAQWSRGPSARKIRKLRDIYERCWEQEKAREHDLKRAREQSS
jgi:hypothetical protein